MRDSFAHRGENKGYGFDTFTGLPENWQVGNKIEKAGSYSNSNKIPKIKGGKFIKGEFIKNTFITSTMGISYKVGAR